MEMNGVANIIILLNQAKAYGEFNPETADKILKEAVTLLEYLREVEMINNFNLKQLQNTGIEYKVAPFWYEIKEKVNKGYRYEKI